MISIRNRSQLWAEVWGLESKARSMRAEIRGLDATAAQAKLVRLPPHQLAVLRVLAEYVGDHQYWSDEGYYLWYRRICTGSSLTRPQARRAMLALRRLGFVEYGNGLWSEDGEPRGSGHRITKAGHAWYWDREVTR